MGIETPEKPDVKTPDPNPADQPQAATKNWFERNAKVIGVVLGALLILGALIAGLHHG